MSRCILYASDTGNFAIGSSAMFKNGQDGKNELLNPRAMGDPQPGLWEVDAGVARWGNGNDLPAQMIKDIELTGVLFGGIDAKVRIAMGKGPCAALVTGRSTDGQEIVEFIHDAEIEEWLEMNNYYQYAYEIMRDLWGLGNAWTKCLFNSSRTRLNYISRTDASKCRFSAINESGNIESVYVSSDWQTYRSKEDKERVQTIPLLNRKFPRLDIESRNSGNLFMLSHQYTLQGRDYYAPSPWYAAAKWVKIAQGVPEMKKAMFANQMHIKYVVTIHPQYWEKLHDNWGAKKDEEKRTLKTQFYEELHKTLAGGENAYKSVWSTMIIDNDTGKLVDAVKIEAIDDKIKDGKLLPDSNAADIEILLPLLLNPSLLGVDFGGGDAYGGGAGSGSNIREAYLAQVMLVESERKMASSAFDLAKYVNGWQERHSEKGRLVLRYPNQILTTLNTGANTKSVS